MAVGAVLAAAALLALSAAERPTRPRAFGSFLLLALVPWLGARFVAAALGIALFPVARLRAQRRGLMAGLGCGLAGFSARLDIALKEGVYRGPPPLPPRPPPPPPPP